MSEFISVPTMIGKNSVVRKSAIQYVLISKPNTPQEQTAIYLTSGLHHIFITTTLSVDEVYELIK